MVNPTPPALAFSHQAFMLQLFYDSVREEPIYQNLLPRQYWRAILSVTVGIDFKGQNRKPSRFQLLRNQMKAKEANVTNV